MSTRYRLVSDNDGHDYIIERGDEAAFDKWVEMTDEGMDPDLDFNDRRVNRSGWTFADPQNFQ